MREDSGEPSLVERARAGDPDAFGELFDLHRDRVFRQAARLTESIHDAEDVTGMVFLEAWRRRASMRDVDGSVIGWLLVTANNVSRNFNRASRRYRHALAGIPLPEPAPDPSSTVDDHIDFTEARDALRSALARLPRRDQDILSLCVIEELSTAEAASVLNVAPGTVKSRLSRAKARLTGMLGEATEVVAIEGGLR
ncbi:RNA polymerase sigma factor [Leifsonia sp. NPDC056665]|uniref:RNA polymerase sigma factor n=1 Tax=Leifsonia sp. NPDC056665 TaxID=3345901 RepID=UPI0036A30D4B